MFFGLLFHRQLRTQGDDVEPVFVDDAVASVQRLLKHDSRIDKQCWNVGSAGLNHVADDRA